MRAERVRGNGESRSSLSSGRRNPLNRATRRHVSSHVAGAGVSEVSEGPLNGVSVGVCASESDVRLMSRNGRLVKSLYPPS